MVKAKKFYIGRAGKQRTECKIYVGEEARKQRNAIRRVEEDGKLSYFRDGEIKDNGIAEFTIKNPSFVAEFQKILYDFPFQKYIHFPEGTVNKLEELCRYCGLLKLLSLVRGKEISL